MGGKRSPDGMGAGTVAADEGAAKRRPPAPVDPRRTRLLNGVGVGQGPDRGVPKGSPVVYWMSRERRARDNWALLRAAELAGGDGRPGRLAVAFCLGIEPGGAGVRAGARRLGADGRPMGARHTVFELEGLRELQGDLGAQGIAFFLLPGLPAVEIPGLVHTLGATAVVTDFDARQGPRGDREAVGRALAGAEGGPAEAEGEGEAEGVGRDREAGGARQPPREAERRRVPLYETDGRNVVPAWLASDRHETAARTFRGRATAKVQDFLENFPGMPRGSWPVPTAAGGEEGDGRGGRAGPPHPRPPALPAAVQGASRPDWDALIAAARSAGRLSPALPHRRGGEEAAARALRDFLRPERLRLYATSRNDPCRPEAVSGLSAYLRFGHLSSARCALLVEEAARADPSLRESRDSFLEELIIRRELSENHVLFAAPRDGDGEGDGAEAGAVAPEGGDGAEEVALASPIERLGPEPLDPSTREPFPAYATLRSCPRWAVASLAVHAHDRRDWTYAFAEWEQGATHDPLWNAAQHELLATGTMHGYMRMYWAKKILEWWPGLHREEAERDLLGYSPGGTAPDAPARGRNGARGDEQRGSPGSDDDKKRARAEEGGFRLDTPPALLDQALSTTPFRPTHGLHGAVAAALVLNDAYEMDGRDPNGIVGCLWALGGLHDQGWKEREVLGKVRYMNDNGCKRKFDVSGYLGRVAEAVERAIDERFAPAALVRGWQRKLEREAAAGGGEETPAPPRRARARARAGPRRGGS